MRNAIFEQYSESQAYRYEICIRKNGLYEVWVQKRFTDEYMGEHWFGYHDIQDLMHITDNMEQAVEIGEEILQKMEAPNSTT